jgi:outer membrane lipoprotein-sorting protein
MKRFILVAIATASTASAQPQPSAPTVLANVQKFYASAKQMTAKFRQDVTNGTFNQTQATAGNLYVLKPSDLRFDYLIAKQGGSALDKSFVLGGSTMWMVDHKNKKIVQSSVQGTVLPAAISFLTGGSGLASEFNLALDTSGKYGAAGMIVLALTPKKPSAQYKELFFVIDPKDWHINESIVIAANGDTNDFHFYAPDLQTPIGPQVFTVNPKALPNYSVVQPNATPPAQTAPTPTKPAPTPAKPGAKP